MDAYNLGYGRVYFWFKNVLAARIKNIELRRMQQQKRREFRAAKIEEHKQWELDREAKLEERKAEWDEIQANIAEANKGSEDEEAGEPEAEDEPEEEDKEEGGDAPAEEEKKEGEEGGEGGE